MDDRMLTYVFLGFGLFAMLLAAHAFFERGKPQPVRYVGSRLQEDDMLATIDTIARRIVQAFPNEDALAQTRRVRDELMLGKIRNADHFEAVILGVVNRLRGDDGPTVQEWTD